MISLSLLQPSEIGNLVYRYDPKEKKNLIFVRSLIDTKISFYVSINGGVVILGANDQRVVTSIEINIPQKKWNTLDDFIEPTPISKANIQLDLINNESLDVETILNAYTNPQRSWVYVTIGENNKWDNLVSVSKDCIVAITNRGFTGLFVRVDV